MPLVDKIRDWFLGEQPASETSPPTAIGASPAEASTAATASVAINVAATPTTEATAPTRESTWVRIGAPAPSKVPQSPAPAEAEDNILTQALDEEGPEIEFATNAAQPPYESALHALKTASTMEERSTVLVSHVYFTEGEGTQKNGIDAPMLAEILTHLNDMATSLGYLFRQQGKPGVNATRREMYPQSWRIAPWLTLKNGHGWIERATQLVQQDPSCRDILQPQVHKLFATWCSQEQAGQWTEVAEWVLSSWQSVAPSTIMSGLYNTFNGHRNIGEYLSKYPHVQAFFGNSAHDSEWVQWCSNPEREGLWLMENHPRINAWDLAESYTEYGNTEHNRERIQMLAGNDKSGALLKAWYGYELTVEEITKHPLAHSLYVHKHAPMYLEEVQPLPDSWNVALSLSQTGRQFCDMLVMTAKAKMSKKPALTMNLPELGPDQN